jgi:hypothetical protein
MKKGLYFLAGGLLLIIIAGISGAYAGGQMGKGHFMTLDSQDFIGALVNNPHGEFLGVVSRLEIDSGGHAFAILNHGSDEYYGEGGGYTPVPIEALRLSEQRPGDLKIVANLDEKQLEAAPFYDPTAGNKRDYEADIYKFYGIQPYWTEEANCP